MWRGFRYDKDRDHAIRTNGIVAFNGTKRQSVNRWKDKLGIAASVGCAVHCAATPILLAFLPALKLTEWMASPEFHQVAAIVCGGLVAISIWPAFRRYRDYRVLGLSTAGLSLIMAAAFFLPDHCCSHGSVSDSQPAGSLNSAGQIHLVSASSMAPNSSADCKDSCCTDSVFAKRRALLAGLSSSAKGSGSAPTDDDPSGSNARPHESHEHTDLASTLFGSATVAWFQPWMTPIGGLFLVLAHALNLSRRIRVCGSVACGCSDSNGDENDDSDSSLAMLQSVKAA